MDYIEFEKYVCDFFQHKDWKFISDTNHSYLEKNYNPQIMFGSKKYLLTDIELYNKLKSIFSTKDLELAEATSLKNKYRDTDFIVAGLQKINEYLYDNKGIKSENYHLFQPVIRLKNLEMCGNEEGYISSFINLCTIDIDTNIDEYLFRIDQWISILSALSLHSSGLRMIFKTQTTKYNGIGIEFNYKGIDLGQANLYKLEKDSKTFFVTDIGFGYERILWILNNLTNFYVPLFPKYEVLRGNHVQNDRIRTSTLMVMSGVLPTVSGSGVKCRNLLKNTITYNDIPNLDAVIEYYYQYYMKFLIPEVTYDDTLSIISEEISNLKKQKLCLENNIKYQKENSMEEVCSKIILSKTRRKK